VGIRTDVEQEVAAARHFIAEVQHERLCGVVIFGVFGAVVAVGVAHAAAFLPVVVFKIEFGLVLRGIDAAVFETHAAAPAVVDHHTAADAALVVEPGEELRRFPGFGQGVPVAVRPDHPGFVALHEVVELGHGMVLGEAFGVGFPERVEPLIEREVEAGFYFGAVERGEEFADEVAAGAAFHAVPGESPGTFGVDAGPEAEAVVVFGGEHHIACAGALEELGPVVGVKEIGVEVVGQVVVGTGAVVVLVELTYEAAVGIVFERMLVPFGVAAFFGVGRHRVDAPVDEDAEFGVRPPRGCGSGVERLPVGCKGLRPGGGGEQQEQ